MIRTLVLTFSTASMLLAPVRAQEQPQAPTYLRTELQVEPLGLDAQRPRFSWEVVDPRRGATQYAYRILVADHPNKLDREVGNLWDSQVIVAPPSPFVTYSGAFLRSGEIYYWRVRTVDAAGHSSPWSDTASFALGPMRLEQWSSSWIRDATPASRYEPPHNGFHSAFTSRADDFQWVNIDLGAARAFDSIRLWPARPFDWKDTPGFLFPERFRVWIAGDPSFETSFVKIVDRSAEDVPNPGDQPVELTFTGVTARYVRLGVSQLASVEQSGVKKHAFALAEMQVLSKGWNVGQGGNVTSSGDIESGAWSSARLVDGDVHSHGSSPVEALPAPLFRKEFRVEGQVTRATLFASALGVYRMSLNGSRVGDQELAPGWTDYNRRVAYEAFDVTHLLRAGDNVLGAVVGDGWYAGRLGLATMMPGVPPRGIYGRKPALCAEIWIERADGKRDTIASDATWRSTIAGPIRASDLLDGETYDARHEMPGFDSPGFDDSAWTPVELALDVAPLRVASHCDPIQATAEVAPIALTEPSAGVYVFDLGQNMVGWCRLKVRGANGAQVQLRYGETLDEHGALYTANLRDAAQTDLFTLKGDAAEILEPSFTYHGFRFVEVSGLAAKPSLGDLVGRVVHTAATEVGAFECSDPMLTRLWQNIRWTQRANLMSVPTDCPQRDERLGWMGDIQAFAPTAAFQMDLASFFEKWTTDVRDAQADDGRFPDFAPHPFGKDARFSGVPAWGDAGVIVPWSAWQSYGDESVIEENYESAVRWIEWVRAHNPDLVWRHDRNNDYGDWLNGDTLTMDGWSKSGGEVPKDVFGTAFFAHSVDLVAQMAQVVHRDADAAKYAELGRDIRRAFAAAFVDSEGAITGDTQAGYALALAFDLVPQVGRERPLARLVRAIEARGDALTTGMMATHHALIELSRGGQHALASKLAMRRAFPSWGFAIDHGATTLWERWDGYVPGRGFQDPGMNSFNHWAFGSVGEWLMRMVAGIDPDESAPGWKHFAIRPRPGAITRARGVYDSIRGRIVSDWAVEADGFRLDIEIPANSSARVYLPARDADQVTEGGRVAKDAVGVRLVGSERDGPGPDAITWRTFDVGAGRYHFRSAAPRSR